jgi:hypothetical protein
MFDCMAVSSVEWPRAEIVSTASELLALSALQHPRQR